MNKEEIHNLLLHYSTNYKEENLFLSQCQAFLESTDIPFSRENLPGHITGSAWVMSPDLTSVLLIHHMKIGLWFQPGGHVDDGDVSIVNTAKREAMEETGLKELTLMTEGLFDLDIHTIFERKGIPEHLHYDFRFIFQSKFWNFKEDVNEIKGIKWVKVKEALLEPEKFNIVKRMLLKTESMT